MPKIKVYYTQIKGYNGPVTYDDFEEVLTELREMIEEMAVGDVFSIQVGEMEKEEFENLEEFEGY